MLTLTLNHEYSEGLTDLLAKFADAATWEKIGARADTERIDPDTEVTVRTPMPKEQLPSTLASRLSNETELVEVYMVPGDVLGKAAEIRMTARADGVPVEIDALISLLETDHRTQLTARAEISSSIPLFGVMIEQAVVPILQKRLSERLERFESL